MGEIVKGGDFSSEAVLAILSRDTRGAWIRRHARNCVPECRGMRADVATRCAGESASERVDRITRTTDPKCAPIHSLFTRYSLPMN